MNALLPFSLIFVGLGSLIDPSRAYACSCAGVGSSMGNLRSAGVVFVGTVARVTGMEYRARTTTNGGVTIEREPGPPTWTFDVAHLYQGRSAQQIVITGDYSDCDEPFKLGEAWLVYASSREGRLATSKCTRTRLRSEAESSQDLVYLEGVEQRQQQGIVYGDVLRRIVDSNGQPALQALFEPMQVVAVGAGRRFEVTTDKWGPFQLVLPPGDFEVWVERLGVIVGEKKTTRVRDGTEVRLLVPVQFKE
jgi:hypothetical protein